MIETNLDGTVGTPCILTFTMENSLFHTTCKEGQIDVVEFSANNQFNTFSINLNIQHVNGMTPYTYRGTTRK